MALFRLPYHSHVNNNVSSHLYGTAIDDWLRLKGFWYLKTREIEPLVGIRVRGIVAGTA